MLRTVLITLFLALLAGGCEQSQEPQQPTTNSSSPPPQNVSEAAQQLENSSVEEQKQALHYLHKNVEKAEPARQIIEKIVLDSQQDIGIRAQATVVLGKMGEAAVPCLVKILQQEPKLHVQAVKSLARIGKEASAAVEELGRLLEEKSAEKHSDLRTLILGTLGNLKHPQALDQILAAKQDPVWQVRKSMVHALDHEVYLKDPQTISTLVEMLEDKQWHVRMGAVEVLANKADNPQALDGLIMASQDKEIRVKQFAWQVLADLPATVWKTGELSQEQVLWLVKATRKAQLQPLARKVLPNVVQHEPYLVMIQEKLEEFSWQGKAEVLFACQELSLKNEVVEKLFQRMEEEPELQEAVAALREKHQESLQESKEENK